MNALISILLADKTSGLVGFLLSTIVIVVFGEIIPQATCARHALSKLLEMPTRAQQLNGCFCRDRSVLRAVAEVIHADFVSAGGADRQTFGPRPWR